MAIEGDTVEFEHKGVKLRLVAATAGSKLARAVKRPDYFLVDPNSIVETDPKLIAEWEEEWKAECEELLYRRPST